MTWASRSPASDNSLTPNLRCKIEFNAIEEPIHKNCYFRIVLSIEKGSLVDLVSFLYGLQFDI